MPLVTDREDPRSSLTRRQFLEFLATSFAALSMTGCKLRRPEEKIVPYAQQPEETVSGAASWYASTCSACPAGCGALVKVRDGRPIKLEGSPEHPLSRGGLCARGQASLLDLYDSQRLRRPWVGGAEASWEEADAAVLRALGGARSIRLLSRPVTSPTLQAAIDAFLTRWPSARQVTYEPLGHEAILQAHRLTHGAAVLPHYRFGAARVIVSFDADFLGTWLSPVEFARDWSLNRRPERDWDLMSWHAQFESRMSLTGANADLRASLKPSEQFATIVTLGRMVARRVGWKGPLPVPAPAPAIDEGTLERTADLLRQAQRRCLVVSGSDDPAVQVVVNWINAMLGNYGSTLDIERPVRRDAGRAGLDALISEMDRGEVDALVCLDANPAYDQARGEDFARALARVRTSVAVADRKDETAELCRIVCPGAHALESWGDAQPAPELLSLVQPAIAPLFDARSPLECVLRWADRRESAYDFLRERWRRSVFPHAPGRGPHAPKAGAFPAWWDEAVRAGAVSLAAAPRRSQAFDAGGLPRLAARARPAPAGAFELAAFPSVSLGDGRQANNPWLQELPDPLTRVSWGNVASFAPEDARRLGLEEGRVVRLSVGGRCVELPAHIQPAQAPGVVCAALGYGRRGAGAIAANFPMAKVFPLERDLLAGADLYPFLGARAVEVAVTGRTSVLAKVQAYDYQVEPLEGQTRPILQETTLQDFFRDSGRARREAAEGSETLWPRHEYKGHKWGLAIDLNACIGCAACVVGCQAENNVPVVGKAEVRKGRDMYWLRIDRYYSGSPQAPAPRAGAPAAQTEVAFQPMLCQHCDNAPCETVCPVLATVHSNEGLNMQAYNRCVGTRYCANNCPYKVRRFNWFDYAHQDLVQNLALNPDVTVRSRGVMEKCSMCTQRIFSADFQARAEGRPVKDGDILPACAQSCPCEAIVFGDLNDPESRVAKLARQDRGYRVLAELGVGPSVFYQKKVRNKQV